MLENDDQYAARRPYILSEGRTRTRLCPLFGIFGRRGAACDLGAGIYRGQYRVRLPWRHPMCGTGSAGGGYNGGGTLLRPSCRRRRGPAPDPLRHLPPGAGGIPPGRRGPAGCLRRGTRGGTAGNHVEVPAAFGFWRRRFTFCKIVRTLYLQKKKLMKIKRPFPAKGTARMERWKREGAILCMQVI